VSLQCSKGVFQGACNRRFGISVAAGTTTTGCWQTWASRAGMQLQRRVRQQQQGWIQGYSTAHSQAWLGLWCT